MNTQNKIKTTIILFALALGGFVFVKFPINLGLDLQGGTRLILEAKDTPKAVVTQDSVLGVLDIIRNRVDDAGYTEATVQRKGQKQIVVELPGIKDPERARSLIGETALLEFVEAEWAPPAISSLPPEKQKILLDGESGRLDKVINYDKNGHIQSERPILLKKSVLEGKDLKKALPGYDSFGNPVVNIEFTPEGTRKFSEVTARNVNKPLAIILDKRVISAPNVKEPILSGKAQISGNFSIQEMKDLVIKLKAGALPVPVEIVSEKFVGPTLGKDSILKSKKAGIAGFIILFLFMLFVYQIPGIIACVALLVYLLLTIASLKLLHATLTLPGIAGLILTLGMAVDANVIIFERIKEELRLGQSPLAAIQHGFSRAFITILDANITTLIAAVVLFWLGTGTIKGFAVTLSIGIVISMFTAIFVSRIFTEGIAGLRNENKIFKV